MFKFLSHATSTSPARVVRTTALVDRVAQATGTDRRTVARTLQGVVTAIEQALAADEQVVITGFGTFYRREHPAGEVRRVGSGERLHYPAAHRPAFRAGKVLKRTVRTSR